MPQTKKPNTASKGRASAKPKSKVVTGGSKSYRGKKSILTVGVLAVVALTIFGFIG